MNYIFATIQNIKDVLPAIKGRDEFIIADRHGYKIINYLMARDNTFQDPTEEGISDEEKLYRALRYECRGIIFCDKKGMILRRPLHKFHNINERPDTHMSLIDITKPHNILAKLDGSMVSPYVADNRLIYGSKMGQTHITDQVLEFIKDKNNYNEFSLHLIDAGYTPIFEFTSPLNRIVISYAEINLTLIAVRHMVSGRYYSYDEMKEVCKKFNIPVVKMIEGNIKNMESFVEETRGKTGEEGYVVRFEDGMQVKLKFDEYVLKHRVKDSISQEKNLVELIITDKIDDVYATLDKEDSDKVKIYADSVIKNIYDIAKKAEEIVKEQKVLLNNEKKRFALEVVPQYKEFSGVLFSVWDGKNALDSIKKQILNNISTQTKVNTVRHLLGPLIWNDVYTSTIED